MSKVSNQQKEIGQFITELRKQRQITQAEFAKRLNTSQSAIARMEKGEQNFSTEMLLKISTVLDQNIISLSKGTISYEVEGGRKLSGEITTNTSKNGAVSLLFASLLNDSPTILRKVPQIEEVHRIIEVLSSLGVAIKWEGSDLTITPPKRLKLEKLNIEAARRTRSAILLMGALSHKFHEYDVPYPGGCVLGARTVTPHAYALERLGLKIFPGQGQYMVHCKSKKAAEIVMYETSDMAAVNAILAAATTPGTTVIRKASANYQVQEVCLFLKDLGVEIEGIGTSILTVKGLKSISRPVAYTLSEDPIESMLFITAAIVTKSKITVKRCPVDFLELELLKLEKMGFKYSFVKRYKAVNGFTNLADIRTEPSNLHALPDKVHSLPYPGINADNLPFFVPIATQAIGETLIHDWMYENRAIYYAELNKLGANVTIADPHRAYIKGPTEFKPAEIVAPPALRPAAIILIAMLAAKGTSVLRNVYTINRGYEHICPRLNQLGAKIKVRQGIN